MAYEGDDTKHELSIEGLLLNILKELKKLNIMIGEASELEIDNGDLDE